MPSFASGDSAYEPMADDMVVSNSVTSSFCRARPTRPLVLSQGEEFWGKAKANGYALVSLVAGSKGPREKDWVRRSLLGETTYRPDHGIGVVCGGINEDGKPTPTVGSLVAFDLDLRLSKQLKAYEDKARKSEGMGDTAAAARFRAVASELTAREEEYRAAIEHVIKSLWSSEVYESIFFNAPLRERPGGGVQNFAALFRNNGAVANATLELYVTIVVEGVAEYVPAMGVDVLASGKQLCSLHIHPDLGVPWVWDGDKSPENIPLRDLPELTAAAVHRLWSVLAKLAKEHGFVEVGTEVSGPREMQVSSLKLPAQLHGYEGKGYLSQSVRAQPSRLPPEQIAQVLLFLNEKGAFKERLGVKKNAQGRIISVGWINTGMALKVAYGEKEGFELWSLTHEDEQAECDAPAQWRSFDAELEMGKRQITLGTLIKAARDLGYDGPLGQYPDVPFDAAAQFSLSFNECDGDLLNARLFAVLHRSQLLFIHETGECLRFDPSEGWVAASPGEPERAARSVVAKLREHAGELYKTASPNDGAIKQLMQHIKKSSDKKHVVAMIELAKSEPGMTVRLSEFDVDLMLLGVRNGVLDLRTRQLLPVTPETRVSKRCNVFFNPTARSERFDRFLREIAPDDDVRSFLQRFVGYCLTGLVDEQVWAFLYGLGQNGKTVLVELIAWLLGDYAKKIGTEMLMKHQRNPQGPSPDIVALKGVRLAYANETAEGVQMDEARIKDLTGGDTLRGRVPFGKADVVFPPTHKLIVVGNHKPVILDASYGMWRRVMLLPFTETIPEERRDRALLEKLKADGPAVLNWALEGLRLYCDMGLCVPSAIKAATAEYRDEQDVLGEFIDEACNVGGDKQEAKQELYLRYSNWCAVNGHKPLSKTRLTQRLAPRGIVVAEDKRRYIGLCLKEQKRGLPPCPF